MSTLTIHKRCHVCKQHGPFQKEQINHILHLLLAIVTGGMWLIVWLIPGVSSGPYLCTGCGTKHTARDPDSLAERAKQAFGLVVLLVLVGILVNHFWFNK